MSDLTGMGPNTPAPKLDPNCQCICHTQPSVMHVVACCSAPPPEKNDLTDDQVRALLDQARADADDSLYAAAEDLARSLLQARADAAAAQALMVERAAENKEQLEIWAHEILEGLAFADVLKIDSYDDNIEAHDMVGRGLVEVIRALAPDAGTAELAKLRDDVKGWADNATEAWRLMREAESERDTLSASLAAAQAQIAGLVDALRNLVNAVENWVAAENVALPEWSDSDAEATMIGATYAGQAALEAATLAAMTSEERVLCEWSLAMRDGWKKVAEAQTKPRSNGESE